MTPHPDFEGRWRTSTRSASQGQCVEVAVTSTAVGVRDSKSRNDGTLRISSARWGDFINGIKLDHY